MKLINQSVEYIPQEKGLEGIYKQIEIAARTCYKSENNSTGDSKSFVDKLIKMKHFSMLEQGTVYLHLKKSDMEFPNRVYNLAIKYRKNPYSRTKIDLNSDNACITTNYRVIREHGWEDDLQYLCEPTDNHVKRYTFRLTTSIGIVRELLRHRVFSFANESTRYCNYSKDKFGGITYIIPHWLNTKEITIPPSKHILESNMENIIKAGIYEPNDIDFLESLLLAECVYIHNIIDDNGGNKLSPQQAREVLPLCTKSELIMTGFEDDWENFLDVRLRGTTGKPHPDMVELAQLIEDELYKVNKALKIRTIHEPSFDDTTKYNNEFPSLKDALDKQKKKYLKDKTTNNEITRE